ncbi:unnamed protein product (macronuclear) [Paramecium tetraurelia]|uniref:Uncharacterized protein n=1 Tax=Paramecium tetraurelia TaxID=5888 RepID=A0DR03_PARTE|nr:uncharacterized protein GSPATT00002871001 [Paramecium tetraurelia]CAK85470.1 unnamed protein product [Paramecium tetraurelia]|eukprot:XP_001452867.1 hypothetical protein (macronuclear) [Paramecium tetraurelia strain d4-2]
MLLLLLASLTYAQHIIFQDDFNAGQINAELWEKYDVAKIVPCPGTTNDYCVNIFKQSFGSGLKSKPFGIEMEQDVTIEFKYLTKSTPNRGVHSGLFVGYTDNTEDKKSGYCWFASGYSYYSDFFNQTSQKTDAAYLCSKDESVLIQDLLNDWKTIKYTIPSATLKNKNQSLLSLVFQDFVNENSEGAYYITKILVYYNKNCTAKCEKCTTFYDCTSCQDPYRWLEGKCYKGECGTSLEQSIPYQKDTLLESSTSTTYSATIKIPGYDFQACWPAQWVTLGYEDGKFTELKFSYETASTAKLILDQQSMTNANCKQHENSNIFTCSFHFNVHFNEQIMYERNWTATIDYSKSSITSLQVPPKTLNPPALVITIEYKLDYCENVNDCQWTTDKITLVLNQRLKILRNGKMEQGYVKLWETGTLVNLPILETVIGEGEIIYTVRLAIKGEKGNGLAVTAKIINPNSAGSGRRRVLEENTNSQLAVGNLNGNLITYKSRQLVIENDPEFSQLILMPLLLIAILGF